MVHSGLREWGKHGVCITINTEYGLFWPVLGLFMDAVWCQM